MNDSKASLLTPEEENPEMTTLDETRKAAIDGIAAFFDLSHDQQQDVLALRPDLARWLAASTRAALATSPADTDRDALLGIVTRTATMGLCSQTHHEHLMVAAEKVRRAIARSGAGVGRP